MIACIIGMAVAIIICTVHYLINESPYEDEPLELPEPFVISEYYDRIERTALEILENREPVDRTIILWWGLDGLKLTEDGELEWVSRKKPKPVLQNVSYQPCQSISPMPQYYTMCQSTEAQIDTLMAQNTMLQFQAAQAEQNMMIVNSLAGYYRYSPWMQSPYLSQLTQCCCTQKYY